MVDTQVVYQQIYDNYSDTFDPYFLVVASLYAENAKRLVQMKRAQDMVRNRGNSRRANAIAQLAGALAEDLANDPYGVLSREDFEKGSHDHTPVYFPSDMAVTRSVPGTHIPMD